MAVPNKINPGIPYRNISYQIIQQEILNGVNQNQRPNQPYLIDLVTLEKVFFQGIPDKIDYNPESTWVAIESPGRNNPLYHYTGSEDSIEFTLTWFCNDESRLDVITKCKWLEALTKNDGYDNKPHPVQFAFGSLFIESKFIVHSARYSLGRFNREYAMMPAYAEQAVVLKRITQDNRRRTEILNYNS